MVVVLLSGGFDSVVLAHVAHLCGDLCGLVFADYGQPAVEQERAAARRCAAGFLLPLDEVVLPSAPGLRVGVGTPGPRVVPGRNLLLVSHAVALTAANGWGEVWLGATADDADSYPDCRQGFVRACNEMALGAYGVAVRAPFLGMTKARIADLARKLGLTVDYAWSCYEPASGEPCGTCDACVRRAALGADR